MHIKHRSALQRCDIARNVAILQIRNVAILFLEKMSQFRNVAMLVSEKRLRICRNVAMLILKKTLRNCETPKTSFFNFEIFFENPY